MDANTDTERKLCGMLGLCARARKLCVGEQIAEAVRSGKQTVSIVLIAKDASRNTKKRLTNLCTYYKTDCVEIDLDKDKLGHTIGRTGEVSAVGIADGGFSAAVKQIIQRL